MDSHSPIGILNRKLDPTPRPSTLYPQLNSLTLFTQFSQHTHSLFTQLTQLTHPLSLTRSSEHTLHLTHPTNSLCSLNSLITLTHTLDPQLQHHQADNP